MQRQEKRKKIKLLHFSDVTWEFEICVITFYFNYKNFKHNEGWSRLFLR